MPTCTVQVYAGTPASEYAALARSALGYLGLAERYEVGEAALGEFLAGVAEGYRANPYTGCEINSFTCNI